MDVNTNLGQRRASRYAGGVEPHRSKAMMKFFRQETTATNLEGCNL